MVEPETPEGPDPVHVAVDLRRFRALRSPDGDSERLLLRRGRRRSRSAHDVPQGLVQPAAAARSPAGHCRRTRRGGGDACDMVRRRLPGLEEPVRTTGRGRGELPGHALGLPPPSRPAQSLAGGPHRLHRRWRPRPAVRLEDRRARPVEDAGRLGLGVHDRRDLRLQAGRERRPDVRPLRLPEREADPQPRSRRLVSRPGRRPGPGRGAGPSTRCARRELRLRDEDRHREGLPAGVGAAIQRHRLS
jgi:hypothetical protein